MKTFLILLSIFFVFLLTDSKIVGKKFYQSDISSP